MGTNIEVPLLSCRVLSGASRETLVSHLELWPHFSLPNIACLKSYKSETPLFVFLKSDAKQNARSLLTPVSDPTFHAFSHGSLGFALHGSFSTIFLLVKILQQPIRIFEISGSWSYHGEENACYHVKEHKKLAQKLVSKVTLHFVWGHLSKKQTVTQPGL